VEQLLISSARLITIKVTLVSQLQHTDFGNLDAVVPFFPT
jgi:hypothetical protein